MNAEVFHRDRKAHAGVMGAVSQLLVSCWLHCASCTLCKGPASNSPCTVGYSEPPEESGRVISADVYFFLLVLPATMVKLIFQAKFYKPFPPVLLLHAFGKSPSPAVLSAPLGIGRSVAPLQEQV